MTPDARIVLLGELRLHACRCRLAANEIEVVAVALAGGIIDAPCAREWLASLEPVPGLFDRVRR